MVVDKVGDIHSFEVAKRWMGEERRKMPRPTPHETNFFRGLWIDQTQPKSGSMGHANWDGCRTAKIRQSDTIKRQMEGM